MPKASFLGGGKAKFGSCYLTNLRFIYEESEWAKALSTAVKFVPTSGDFGLKEVLKGSMVTFDAYFIITKGREGKLSIVKKDGRVIIPLSEIKEMILGGNRWIIFLNQFGVEFIYEIYDLPPDRSGFFPTFVSWSWKQDIETVKNKNFGTSNH